MASRQEVAERADVSVAVVSYVLNGRTNVNWLYLLIIWGILSRQVYYCISNPLRGKKDSWCFFKAIHRIWKIHSSHPCAGEWMGFLLGQQLMTETYDRIHDWNVPLLSVTMNSSVSIRIAS
ncbi:hypothetical protein A8709_14695 [Paenibacillus pectinilyticus]|uniref:Uncharacterized protein n=1 Tax=Paenibacillus pectinilyticus TaxID=512399 RepID=A0A1C1A449_9BACL|nr:LacI family DNA-binding transcriptional regulator [Paenibacillus pectinilyticus]OCT15337.1 hypothetical protein A8709_14695 [Paenibacillus pectinilyticus]